MVPGQAVGQEQEVRFREQGQTRKQIASPRMIVIIASPALRLLPVCSDTLITPTSAHLSELMKKGPKGSASLSAQISSHLKSSFFLGVCGVPHSPQLHSGRNWNTEMKD